MSEMLRRVIMMMNRVPVVTYATWNPADKYSGVALSGGNLTATTDGVAQNEPFRATIGKSSGKWYWEIVGANNVGISTTSLAMSAGNYPGADVSSYGYNKTGVKLNNGGSSAYGATFTNTDVIGVAFDISTGTLIFYKNGVSQGTAFTGLSGTFYPTATVFSGDFGPCTANFGASTFTYSPPGGYNAGLYT